MQTIWIFDFLKYFLPWSKFSIWSPVASPISQGLRLQREWHGFNSRSNIFCISCMTLQILEEFGPPNQPNRRHGIWPKTEPHRTRHNRTGTYPGTHGGEKEPSIMVGANPRYISSFGHCGQLPPCNSRFKCPDSAYWWSHKKKTPPPERALRAFIPSRVFASYIFSFFSCAPPTIGLFVETFAHSVPPPQSQYSQRSPAFMRPTVFICIRRVWMPSSWSHITTEFCASVWIICVLVSKIFEFIR